MDLQSSQFFSFFWLRKMKRRESSETRFGKVSRRSEPSSRGKRPFENTEPYPTRPWRTRIRYPSQTPYPSLSSGLYHFPYNIIPGTRGKTRCNSPKNIFCRIFLNFFDFVRNFLKASGLIRTHPDASECIRTHPGRSQQVRASPKPSENLRKLAKNLRKLRENF